MKAMHARARAVDSPWARARWWLAVAALLFLVACGGSAREVDEEEEGEAPPLPVPHVVMDGEGNGLALWSEGWEVRQDEFLAERLTPWSGPSRAFEFYNEDPVRRLAAFHVPMFVVALRDTVDARYHVKVGSPPWQTVQEVDMGGLAHCDIAGFETGLGPHVLAACISVWPYEGFEQVSGVVVDTVAERLVRTHLSERVAVYDQGLTAPFSEPCVAVGGDGTGAVIWQRFGIDELYIARYDGGWQPSEVVGDMDGPYGAHDVAMDAAGNIVVLWVHADQIHLRRFHGVPNTWGSVETLPATVMGITNPKLVLHANGEGAAVWWEDDVTGGHLQASRRVGGSWTNPTPIDGMLGEIPPPHSRQTRPLVGTDGAGNVRTLWESRGEIYTAAFYDRNGTWDFAERLGPGRDPDLAMDGTGRAIGVWWDTALVKRVWDPLPPPGPDPDLLVYSSNQGGTRNIWITTTHGTALTSTPVQVTSDPADDWSPTLSFDGTRICFVRGADIWVVDTDGSNPRQLTDTPTWEEGPTFTADGDSVIYGVLGNLVRHDLTTDVVTQLTDSGRDGDPSVSPDGTTLAFRSTRDLPSGFPSPGNLWTVPLDGSAPPTAITLSVAIGEEIDSYSSPAWSPDGQQIVCECYDGVDTNNIVVMDVDGSDLAYLTSVAEEENRAPVFTPDGEDILFTCRRKIPTGAFVFELRSIPSTGAASPIVLADGEEFEHPSVPGQP